MTEAFRYRNAHRIVGMSILVLLLLVAATIVLLLHKNEAFGNKNEYYLQANQTQLRGLNKSMAVRILGEPVGTVTDIAYIGSSSEVRLTMQVKAPNDGTKNVIWENSRMIVARSFGIGEPYLEIERGNDILGVIVENLLDREADAIRVQNTGSGAFGRGVRIQKLVAGSPAETAGLKVDEIITSFNGVPVDSLGEMYEIMSMVSEGTQVTLGIHGRAQPVVVTTGLVLADRLESGGMIIQFQPEENRLEGLASKLTQVQESIASVEKNLVKTLSLTNSQMENSLVPALEQFVATSQSVEKTSDQVREDTLDRTNQTLQQIEDTSTEFSQRIGDISENFAGFLDNRAGPSFDQFSEASASLEETTQSLRVTTESVGSEANVALRDLQVAAEKLNNLLDQSQTVVTNLERESQQLPGTVNRVNRAVDSSQKVMGSTQKVMDGLSEHWLLRRAVKRSEAKKSGKTKTGPIRSMLGN